LKTLDGNCVDDVSQLQIGRRLIKRPKWLIAITRHFKSGT